MISCLILAAGKGTRMRSDLPKVLHPVAGEPMVAHVVRAATSLQPVRVALVVAPGMEAVQKAASAVHGATQFAVQTEQKGTAHAVLAAEAALSGAGGTVLILYGDTPLLTPHTLERLAQEAAHADVVVLGMRPKDPTGYGRLITKRNGTLLRIVECKEAGPKEKRITLCNSGVMAVREAALWPLLAKVKPQAQGGEYYLTDIVAHARAAGLKTRVVEGDAAELLGVNTKAQLAEAEAHLQQRLRARAMEQGVTMIAPETVFLAADTTFGRDVVVKPYVIIEPGVRVGAGCTIGPFARLRPGAVLAEGVHIGNFVEIKQSVLDVGAKVNHLTYVGDATVGAGANIGAGTITCNYDGVHKHKTEIGAGAFIGSNTALVAPVKVGARAVVGAGSVITEDVPEGALGLGRGRQVNKPR